MKLNTKKKGLEAIFKKWQILLIEEIFQRTLMSREGHELFKERDIKIRNEAGTVSRASVIIFFNELVDQRLLDYDLRSGKGGYHRIYKSTLSREEFAHKVISKFINKLCEAYPEESKNFPWPNSA